MERKDSQSNIRLYVLASLLGLALVVYIGVLYDIQVNQHDYYLAKSIRTITQEETVEASRGVITDRSGREMVSSRSSYNLTFDSSALAEGEDENEAILRLVKLCQSQGVAWVDNLPITKTAPFSYTFTSLTELDDTQRNRFTAFLRDQLEVVPEDTKAEDITADYLSSLGLSAHAMVERMRQEFKVPVTFSLNEARSVIGVRYELSIRKLMNTTAYAMAEDIDTEMISLLNDGDYAGAKITASSVREYKTTYAAQLLGTVTLIYKEEYDALKEQGYSGNDRIGRFGVEAAFEQYLRGTDGKRIVSTNAAGKITGEYYEKAPQPGNTVELTIDLSLQQAVEQALAGHIARDEETRRRLLELVHPFAPTVTDTFGVSAALSRALNLDERLSTARVKLEGARTLADSLPRPEEVSGGTDVEPRFDPAETAARLSAAEGELSRLRSGLAMAQGELNTLGDREALQTRREAIQEELDRRRAEYDALGAALAALERAHSGLQARFSPALNRRAGELLAELKYLGVTAAELEALVKEAYGT